MPGIFSDYRVAILDSSIFTSDFSQDVKSGLESIKVYVAGSFVSELEQYRLFLSKDKLAVFNSNLSFLQKELQVNAFDITTAGEKANNLHNDIWSLITFLVSLEAKFVVITANQILIQRMILSDIPADIYDLNTDSFRYASTFAMSKPTYEFGQIWPEPCSPAKVAKEGTVLYKNGGGVVTLANEVHSGLEGALYKIKGQSQLVAKVFNNDELTADKYVNLKNIAGINKRYDIPFAIFPNELLYYDTGCRIPAGFTETFVKSGENLGDNPLYLGNVFDCPEMRLYTRQSESIELCLKIVRQICYLNVLGFIISDFNYSNFSLPDQNTTYVQMWDSDSFGYGKFFSGIDAGYSLSRDYDYSTKKDAIVSCYDELYLFAFSILSLGDYPISEKDGIFKYSKSDYLAKPIARSRKKLFPYRMWQLFSDVFTLKKEPSAEALLDQLTVTLQELKANPSRDKNYKELLSYELPKPSEPNPPDPFTPPPPPPPPPPDGDGPTIKNTDQDSKLFKILLFIILAIIGFIIVWGIEANSEGVFISGINEYYSSLSEGNGKNVLTEDDEILAFYTIDSYTGRNIRCDFLNSDTD